MFLIKRYHLIIVLVSIVILALALYFQHRDNIFFSSIDICFKWLSHHIIKSDLSFSSSSMDFGHEFIGCGHNDARFVVCTAICESLICRKNNDDDKSNGVEKNDFIMRHRFNNRYHHPYSEDRDLEYFKYASVNFQSDDFIKKFLFEYQSLFNNNITTTTEGSKANVIYHPRPSSSSSGVRVPWRRFINFLVPIGVVDLGDEAALRAYRVAYRIANVLSSSYSYNQLNEKTKEDLFMRLLQIADIEYQAKTHDDGGGGNDKIVFSIPPSPLFWSCGENCNYHCMMMTMNSRISSQEQIVKFRGKWPFKRIKFCQVNNDE
jgi:hypothetical protein